mgnify:CR=1 FL=1
MILLNHLLNHMIKGLGRRKEARARVILTPEGQGTIVVNGKPFETYFPVTTQREMVMAPLHLSHNAVAYNIEVSASGGGKYGQAQSAQLGIARALLTVNPELRPSFRAAGLLTRDPRAKERKKPGLKRARRAPQWQKR